MPLLIATCRDWPQGSPDLQALAAALGAHLQPWQDITPGTCAQATVLPLAVWDYSQHPAAYRHWLHGLQSAGARVLNPPALQDWNLDKRYLCALAQHGLPVTPSLPLLAEAGADWARTIAQSGWAQGVVKPLIGQSGRGVRRLGHTLPTPAEYPHGALLQEFVPSTVGEVCLIHIHGQFTHAAHRQPPAGEWRANAAYGVQIQPITPQPQWLHTAARVLQHLPPSGAHPPLYARVDGLITPAGDFLVNELELIEPALYPQLHPQGPEGLAKDLQTALQTNLKHY